jgi:hypothetical protein
MNDYPKHLRDGTRDEYLFQAKIMRKNKKRKNGCLRNIFIALILLTIFLIIMYLKSQGMF